MAMFRNIRLDVHEEAVLSYIRPGGEVNDLLWEVARDTRDYGKVFVANGHVRSGRLLGGIKAAHPQMTGPLQAASRASSAARHTIYFHDGTTGPIFGRPHLVVPKRRGVPHTNTAFSGAGAQLLSAFAKGKRGSKGVWRPDAVRGQRAKPFLKDGLSFALRKHGLVTR